MVLPVRRLADAGLEAWHQVIERGYEGLVGKDPASPYVGGRTLKWLKVQAARVPGEGAGVLQALADHSASLTSVMRSTYRRSSISTYTTSRGVPS
jgi:ATP-dependent DNA ligase